jgi:hypothetical protein
VPGTEPNQLGAWHDPATVRSTLVNASWSSVAISRGYLPAPPCARSPAADGATRSIEQLLQLQQLRSDIQEGLASGTPTPWNPQDIKQDGRKRKASRGPSAQGT